MLIYIVRKGPLRDEGQIGKKKERPIHLPQSNGEKKEGRGRVIVVTTNVFFFFLIKFTLLAYSEWAKIVPSWRSLFVFRAFAAGAGGPGLRFWS